MLRSFFIYIFYILALSINTANAQAPYDPDPSDDKSEFKKTVIEVAQAANSCVLNKNKAEIVKAYLYHLANADIDDCEGRAYVEDAEISSYTASIVRWAMNNGPLEKCVNFQVLYNEFIERIKQAVTFKRLGGVQCPIQKSKRCRVDTNGSSLSLRAIPHIGGVPSYRNKDTIVGKFRRDLIVFRLHSHNGWSYVEGFVGNKRQHGWSSDEYLDCN